MTTSDLPLKRIARGKVRDVYEVDGDRLLLVATDRVSAYDVVMAEPIPMKGAVLTQISAWWFRQLERRREAPHDLGRRRRDHRRGAGAQAAPRRDRRPRHAVPARHGVPHRMRRSAAISRARRGANMPSRARSPARRCRLASRKAAGSIRRSSVPATKAESGHDENITVGRMARGSGQGRDGRARAADARGLHQGPRRRAEAGHHHRRHQVRVRPRPRRARSC